MQGVVGFSRNCISSPKARMSVFPYGKKILVSEVLEQSAQGGRVFFQGPFGCLERHLFWGLCGKQPVKGSFGGSVLSSWSSQSAVSGQEYFKGLRVSQGLTPVGDSHCQRWPGWEAS